MRHLLLLLATLVLAGVGHTAPVPPTSADKVFDGLFGAEPTRVAGSRGPRAGRDDLSIVEMFLGRHRIVAAQPAYATAAGLCLPLIPVLDALEIGHETDGDRTIIRLYAPDRQIIVDPASLAGALTMAPEGPCLALAAWARVLPLSAQYDEMNLRVILESTEPLPVSARLDRAERRRQSLVVAPVRPDFPMLDNPWRGISAPTLDLALSTRFGNSGTSTSINADAVADIARMTGRLRAVTGSDGDTSVRILLGRDSEDADQLGPLHARSFAIGDVNAPAQPLIGASASGRGLIISNRPQWHADLFDQIELRGPLPRGWDAELHRDDRLVAVCDQPDAQGDYVFSDVTLRAGANNYVVRLFGPHGETEERAFNRFIGSELNAENEFIYAAGIVDGSAPMIGPPTPTTNAGERFAFATVEHGLVAGMSMRVDLHAPLSGGSPAVAAGLHAAAFGGFSSLLVAGDGRGRPAVALRGARLVGTANITLDVADYGNLRGTHRPGNVDQQQREMGISVETRIAVGRRSMPVTLGWRHALERTGSSVDRIDFNLALAVGDTRIANRASLERRRDARGASQSVLGNLAMARGIGSWRLRGGIDYRIGNNSKLRQFSLAASRATPRGRLGVDFGWDAERRAPGASIAFDRRLGAVFVGGGAGIGSNGWQAGVTVSAALFHSPQGGFQLGPPGIAQTATFQPHVFEDVDGDGIQGAAEPAIEGASFLVASSLRRETTTAGGRAQIGGIVPNRRVDMALRLASLTDLQLRPATPGIAAQARPGQILEVPVPLRRTGEIEVKVEAVNGDVHRPLTGLEVAIVDATDERIQVVLTDFEGFAYFDGVPQGRYRLETVGAAPLPVTISRDALVMTGLNMIVARQERRNFGVRSSDETSVLSCNSNQTASR